MSDTTDLTTADGFELASATHHTSTGDQDATDRISIDRWSNYGHDRLYLNDLATGDGYLDLQTGDSDGDRWTKVWVATDLDGDTLTLKIGNMATYKDFDDLDARYTVVVTVHGDGFEASPDPRELDDDLTAAVEAVHECPECGQRCASEHGVAVHQGLAHSDDADEDEDEADTDEEPTAADTDGPRVAVTDGGRQHATRHVSDAQIQQAIADADDPDHPDATTVTEVRRVLRRVHEQVWTNWDEVEDVLDDGALSVVAETRGVLVLDDPGGRFLAEELAQAGVGDDVLISVIRRVQHAVADEHADRNWPSSSPVVLALPMGWTAGRTHTLRSIARRARDLDSGRLAAAIDQLVVDELGWSASVWARLTGRADSSVSRSRQRS